MKTSFKMGLLLFLLALFLLAQETKKKYGKPMTIHNGISSAFQEFRSNHFHAGIDLRTFQRTGFPVLAIADGAIEQIYVARRGYGRRLIVRHRDGYSSLYAHLDRFRSDLEAVVARVRSARGEKYFGAYALPVPLAVRRGEVIAFSGESGAGFAHLHVEIRDGADRALNPLMLIDSLPADEHPPHLRGVLLRSRGGSLLNGDCGEFYFKLRKNGAAYTLAEPLKINGPCDVVLEAVDYSDVRHVVAPFSLQADLDGRPVFRVTFDRLSRDDNNQLGMLYDMAHSTPASYFFNLCSQSGFSLEKTGVRLAEELQGLAPGLHEIRVVVSDQQQNRALAVLPLLKSPAGEPRSFARKPAPVASGNGLMRDTEFSAFVNRGDVVIKAKDFPAAADHLKLKLIQGGAEQVVDAREYVGGVYFCFQPLNHELHLQLRFQLFENGLIMEERQKTLQAVWLKDHHAQTVRFGEFAAEFGPTAVREPTVLLLENVALQPDLPLLGVPVRSAPNHFAFLDEVFFKFRVPAGTERPEQLGIFKYHAAAKKWSYVPTQTDRETGYLSCRVLSAGTYALLRDTSSPAVTLGRPRSKHLKKLHSLVVRIRDRGKGVDDNTLAVFLNGRKVEAEYDPDWGHVILSDLPHIKKGENGLRIRVADLAGNLSEKQFAFVLK